MFLGAALETRARRLARSLPFSNRGLALPSRATCWQSRRRSILRDASLDFPERRYRAHRRPRDCARGSAISNAVLAAQSGSMAQKGAFAIHRAGLSDPERAYRIQSEPIGSRASLSDPGRVYRIQGGPIGSRASLSDPERAYRIQSGPIGSRASLSSPERAYRSRARLSNLERRQDLQRFALLQNDAPPSGTPHTRSGQSCRGSSACSLAATGAFRHASDTPHLCLAALRFRDPARRVSLRAQPRGTPAASRVGCGASPASP